MLKCEVEGWKVSSIAKVFASATMRPEFDP